MKSLKELKEFFAKVKYYPTIPSQYNKFCELIEIDELMAWQTVFGSIKLLNHYGAKLNEDKVYELAKGVKLMWYENGNLWSESNYKKYKNGIYCCGVYKLWYDNNKLWAEYNVNEGVFHGERKVWDDNGKLIEHSIWENGELIELKHEAYKYPMKMSIKKL